MRDFENIADRLEAACVVSDGRPFLEAMSELAEAQLALGEKGNAPARNLGETNRTLVSHIAGEAKRFDDLAAAAREAINALRSRTATAAPTQAQIEAAARKLAFHVYGSEEHWEKWDNEARAALEAAGRV